MTQYIKQVKSWGTAACFLIALAILVSGCGGGGDGGSGASETPASTVRKVACPAAGTTEIAIVSMTEGYVPGSVTIPVDGTVKWTNIDSLQHNIASTDVPINSSFNETVNPGASVCLQFTSTGTFHYHRSYHPSMPSGVVIVQ